MGQLRPGAEVSRGGSRSLQSACRSLPPRLAAHRTFAARRARRRIAYNMPGGPTPVAVAAVSALIELVVLISIVLARLASRRGQAAAAPPLAAQAAALGAQLKREPGAAGRSSWRWLALPAAVLAGLEIG